ncbi:type II secretion system protein GspM [Pseudomonas sp. H11T01]|uniref:type II secretion system protein GspM n=1 Tax=Pseudomonas sp. H11T01 TaxID=3402749 RepID=UPI003ACB4FCC
MNKQSLMRLRARWQHFNGRARVIWQGLALREKRMVAGTALVLGGLLIWLLLIQPPLKKIDYWQAETPKLRAQTEALDVLLREVATPPAGQNLEQSLQQTLDASGLAGRYKLQPEGAAWRLTFEDAPADAVIGWLLGNPRQFSLEVVEARLQRADNPSTEVTAGTLSGTVRMDQAQGAKEAS